MAYNEEETRLYLIDPTLRDKGHNDQFFCGILLRAALL